MENMKIDTDLTHVKNKAQKEKKSLKNVLSSIGKYATLFGVMGLPLLFPQESIKVPKGSTLSHIAQEHGTSWQRLAQRNKLENPDYIQAGQDLIIHNKGYLGLCETASDAHRYFAKKLF